MKSRAFRANFIVCASVITSLLTLTLSAAFFFMPDARLSHITVSPIPPLATPVVVFYTVTCAFAMVLRAEYTPVAHRVAKSVFPPLN